MTVIRETRKSAPSEGGKFYEVYVPLQRAGVKALDKHTADAVREFLYRQGCRVDHIPDDQLLRSIRYTFSDTRAHH